jgi:3-methyladenine DNA glycosylase Tag
MPRREKGAPPQIKPKRLGDYLEVMSKAVFQSGMSWDVVEAKWPGTREAFGGFDAEAVARMSDREIDKLATDTRLIRNRRKIAAVVENANKLIALDAEHKGFRKYLRSFGGDYYALVKDLRKQFKFLGDTGCYMFLYVVGEPVPEYHEWRDSQGRPHSR